MYYQQSRSLDYYRLPLDTRKAKVLSLPETIKEKSTFRAKALRREGRRRAFARNVDFSFIISGSERTFTFRVSLNTLPTLATLVRDIAPRHSGFTPMRQHLIKTVSIVPSSFLRFGNRLVTSDRHVPSAVCFSSSGLPGLKLI